MNVAKRKQSSTVVPPIKGSVEDALLRDAGDPSTAGRTRLRGSKSRGNRRHKRR